MVATNNYVVGRGKIYFDQFAAGTTTTTGERYVGNTPALAMTATYQMLDHYNSDAGLRVKDESVQLQQDRNGSFTCDNISMENVALVFGSSVDTDVQAAVTGDAELLTVKKGLYYQLGVDAETPDGVMTITSPVVTTNSGVHASGTVTFATNPTAADTVTIDGDVITFVAGTPAAHQVQIGGTVTVTAQAFKAEINAYPNLYRVAATGAAAAITLTAIASGTGGNAITMAKSGTHPTLSGATLSGGTASAIIVSFGNYEIDLDTARIHILDDAVDIDDDDVIEVQYSVTTGSRFLVVDEHTQVEGALRFIADNAVGANTDYYWPRVKLTPSGEYALKSDTWQQMVFNFEVLVKGSLNRTYIRRAAA